MNPKSLAVSVLFAATAAFAFPVHAASPAAPAVSVHAGLKQLQFTWNRVPEATRYELWFYPTTGAAWVRYAQLPRWRTSVAVNIAAHLLNWENARYVLKACNASGCGRSPHIGVSHLMQQTVGYFKPAAQVPRQWMGWTTALSENGSTLAAAIETDESGGVEVFRKSSAGWAYEARLLADPKEQDLIFPADPAVAISGEGDVVALGVDVEIRPDALPENDLGTGAVYVFRRTPTGWTREQKLTFADARPEDKFGLHVALDESGTLLAAWRRFGDLPEGAPVGGIGVVELFRHTSAGWTRTTVPADGVGCIAMGLSGDGNTLVRSCGYAVEVLTAPTWQRVALLPNEVFSMVYSIEPRVVAVSHDGRSFAARSVTLNEDGSQTRAWVNVYRLGAAGWAREATLGRPGNFPPGDPSNPDGGFGLGLSLSRDGRFLAVGGTGAGVYVYERKSAGWSLRQTLNQLTPGNPDSLFGWSVSFGRNGKDLAVAAPWDPSSATGVGGNPLDTSAPFRGAVWLY